MSVIGGIGSGKSTLANLVAKAASGSQPFQVSSQPMHSEQPRTKAVDMCRPVNIGDDTQLVVLDCCGIGLRSFDVESRLLTFLCLVSSRIILNQVGGIDDNIFEHLQFVQTMSALLKGRQIR